MADKFEQWGIVELMGHQRAAGRLSEESIGGANMLRVDMPEMAPSLTPSWAPGQRASRVLTSAAHSRVLKSIPRTSMSHVGASRQRNLRGGYSHER